MNNLRNFQIIITGVTGWIGSRLLHRLLAMGLNYGTDIIGIGSQVKALCDGMSTFTFDDVEAKLDARPKLIFHFAFITKDKVNDQTEKAYVDKNHALRDAVAHLLEAYPTHAFIYASSGAVYKFLEKTDKPDLYLYGKLKYEDELFFDRLTQERNIRYILPRIFNLSGANINKIEHYALANFIQAAIDQKPITIKANHHVIRSYVDIDTLLTLLLALAVEQSVECIGFDVSSAESLELHELASKIIATLPVPAVTISAQPNRMGEDIYVGSAQQWVELLKRFNIEPLSIERQIMNTYHSLTGVKL